MSTLEARLERLEKSAGPADEPCMTVNIKLPDSHLLTDGKPTEETSRPRKRSGHKCSERCMRVAIAYSAVSEGTRGDSAAPQLALPAPSDAGAAEIENASTEPSRGDAQPGQERAAVGRGTEAQPGPPRSNGEGYGAAAGLGERLPAAPAREAVVEVERTAPPALVSPLEVEMRQEAAAVARAFARDVQQLVPWWLPVVPSPLAACAVPWCHHDATEHRGIRLRLACRVCGFQADQHDPDGIVLVVPQYARRVSPCGNYKAIYVDEADRDCCEHPGCTCRAYHRWVPFDPYDPRTASDMRTTEMARALAETREQLARLQAEIDAAQRERLRATSKPTDLGASPHGAPVFVEGEGL